MKLSHVMIWRTNQVVSSSTISFLKCIAPGLFSLSYTSSILIQCYGHSRQGKFDLKVIDRLLVYIEHLNLRATLGQFQWRMIDNVTHLFQWGNFMSHSK